MLESFIALIVELEVLDEIVLFGTVFNQHVQLKKTIFTERQPYFCLVLAKFEQILANTSSFDPNSYIT